MKVIVGSNNKAKLQAVKTVFPTDDIVPYNAPSGVSAQPLTEEETRLGAINRASHSYKQKSGAIGIGLEGGVTVIDNLLYLCSWGALVADGELFTAGGTKIMLPQTFIQPLQDGAELSDLMDQFTNKKDVRNNEGAVGIFTHGAISRSELFGHIVKLLKGQWDYAKASGLV